MGSASEEPIRVLKLFWEQAASIIDVSLSLNVIRGHKSKINNKSEIEDPKSHHSTFLKSYGLYSTKSATLTRTLVTTPFFTVKGKTALPNSGSEKVT
jgi:hypothetical protein